MNTDTQSIYNFKVVHSGCWCQIVVNCGRKVISRSEMMLSTSKTFDAEKHSYISSFTERERNSLEYFNRYVERLNSLRRKHASLYLEPNDMEKTKEISLAMKLRPAIEPTERCIVNYLKPLGPHPDIEIKFDDDSLIAVEITELVNHDAVKMQITHQKYLDEVDGGRVCHSDEKERQLYLEYLKCLLDWNSSSFNARVKVCIDNKDDKYIRNIPDRSQYKETILLIHTNEPRLSTHRINEYLGGSTAFESKYFDSVYLVWYHPPKTNIKKIN